MSISSQHPEYKIGQSDWILMEDSNSGERTIKAKGQIYLPATSGQVLDGMANKNDRGFQAYSAYKMRAVYHNFVYKAVESAIGIMHQKPPIIQLPKKMEPMRDNATIAGESLKQLLRRINEAQLIAGRFGLLLDFPQEIKAGEEVVPYIATYNAQCMINWDEGHRTDNQLNSLNLVVLDETGYRRTTDFTWENIAAYRVLILGDPHENETEGIYKFGVFKSLDSSFDAKILEAPTVRGKKSKEIPFVFVNSKDIIATIDEPPLINLANLALAVYRGEADYRQALFMQGQDTLVITGGMADPTEQKRVGAGTSISLMMGGKAEFIGTSSQGLPEMRKALENDKLSADGLGATILKTSTSGRESGAALSIRVAAETATLNQIVLSGAAALEKILKIGARWFGAEPEEVVIKPNMDFISDQLGGKELVELVTAKVMGAPISMESIHKLMQEKGLTDLEFDEELAAIEAELDLVGTKEGGDEGDEG